MSICWNRSQSFLHEYFTQSRYANVRKYSCLPACLIFEINRKNILTFSGTQVPRISSFDVVKNKELLVQGGGGKQLPIHSLK